MEKFVSIFYSQPENTNFGISYHNIILSKFHSSFPREEVPFWQTYRYILSSQSVCGSCDLFTCWISIIDISSSPSFLCNNIFLFLMKTDQTLIFWTSTSTHLNNNRQESSVLSEWRINWPPFIKNFLSPTLGLNFWNPSKYYIQIFKNTIWAK